MPNIRGISDTNGNITITRATGATYSLERTALAKLAENASLGASIKTDTEFDVYVHLYTDSSKVNANRTAIMVCKKGGAPVNKWWAITSTPLPVK